jgi:hypothetical protein
MQLNMDDVNDQYRSALGIYCPGPGNSIGHLFFICTGREGSSLGIHDSSC